MEQISATISVMDVLAITLSAMKCEICFLLQCHQSAKVRTAFVKRVDARFGLAHVPGRSSHAVFNGIHDAYIVLLFRSKPFQNPGGQGSTLAPDPQNNNKNKSFVGDTVLTVLNLCTCDVLCDNDNHILQWHITSSQSHKYPLKTSEIELVHLEIVGNSVQIFGHTIIGISLNHSQNPLITHSVTW